MRTIDLSQDDLVHTIDLTQDEADSEVEVIAQYRNGALFVDWYSYAW